MRGEGLKALIAGIVPSSFVDGPGNRFVVFMQGCNLRCIYCQNPETWDPTGKNNPLCVQMNLDTLLKLYSKYSDFTSGITFSGGEPLLQWPFIKEFSRYFRKRYPDKNIIVDTNIDIEPTVIDNIANYVDYFTPDLKAPNNKLYKLVTGEAGNFENMLSNLKLLSSKDKVYEIRLPIIPTITDNLQCFNEWVNILEQYFDENIRVRIVKFRPYGVKNIFLKSKTVSKHTIEKLIKLLKSRNIKNIIYLG